MSGTTNRTWARPSFRATSIWTKLAGAAVAALLVSSSSMIANAEPSSPQAASRQATVDTIANAEPAKPAALDTIAVGRTWYDTDGRHLQAHGGGFLEHEGWYYWVGEDRSAPKDPVLSINLYRSKDLVRWDYVGDLLTKNTPGICTTGSYNKASCKLERPKLIYNKATKKFVLWVHWETDDSYAASHMLVATSDTIGGSYNILRNYRPGAGEVTFPGKDPTYPGTDGKYGYGSRDLTVFQDPDTGEAFLISAQDHLTMRVYKLTDNFTDVDWKNSYTAFEGERREAPALTKIGDKYALITSAQSGWSPNQALYSITSDISDPKGWSKLKPIGNNATFYSQPTNIMRVATSDGGYRYIYMGDRWNRRSTTWSNYVWLPLQVNGTELSMDYYPEWGLDFESGTISVPDVKLVSEKKPVIATEVNPAHPPTHANDGIRYNLNRTGDNSNYYEPPRQPYSWQVDLGSVQDLARIDLGWRNFNGSEGLNRYMVEGSVDGNAWAELADNSNLAVEGFTSDKLTGKYRHVRVSVIWTQNSHNGDGAAWASGLVEVQVYAHGSPGGGDGGTKPVRYEAETAPATCDGAIKKSRAGYSGSGYCDPKNATGTAAQFTVNAKNAGTATLQIRYANGSSARSAGLVVNGSAAQPLTLEGTGSWGTWTTKAVTVQLKAGSNTIQLASDVSRGLPYIDYVEV